jgi:hypothetical protein
MAFTEFKPRLWADNILENLDKKLVFGNLANRSYEGEIKAKGNSVVINEIGEVTVNNYDGSEINYEELPDAAKLLLIDRAKYAAITIDDIDRVQANADLMAKFTKRMGYAIADEIDQYLATLRTEAGIIEGATDTVTEINSENITAQISNMAKLMDEENVPDIGRVLVAPPWFFEKITLAKIDKETSNAATLANGFQGRILGFDAYKSNNVASSGTTWYAPMFFVEDMTYSLAQQILSVEPLRREDTFADALRTLSVYGAKVLYPDTLGVLYCKPIAEE